MIAHPNDIRLRHRIKPPPGRLRIIGGVWRSRFLPVVQAPGLRPTPARVRETLFNWLASKMIGSRCLVLFAGTGAIGFEALSRGAKSVVMVEHAHKVFIALREAKTLFKAENADIINTDVMRWLSDDTKKHTPFDYVFVDPPFQQNMIPKCLCYLHQYEWVREDGLVYFESHQPIDSALDDNWIVVKRAKAGKVFYGLLAKST